MREGNTVLCALERERRKGAMCGDSVRDRSERGNVLCQWKEAWVRGMISRRNQRQERECASEKKESVRLRGEGDWTKALCE